MTIKTGVIGHPIAHSKSPLIHNYWINHYGLSGTYEALDIPPEELKTALPDLLKNHGYRGFNLTIPHKEIAMNICDEIDEVGHKIGAVNTVMRRKDGSIFGSNTDAFGFIHNVKSTAPDHNFKNAGAVVLGAGGAAKAIIYGLLQEGVPEIIVLNRTYAKAQALAANNPRITARPWDERSQVLGNQGLLVNTTALGMIGKEDLDIELNLLPQSALVCDIVYNPLMTPLLQAAQGRGHKIVTGIGMLLHQARPAFNLWYGIMPDVTETLEEIVLKP